MLIFLSNNSKNKNMDISNKYKNYQNKINNI